MVKTIKNLRKKQWGLPSGDTHGPPPKDRRRCQWCTSNWFPGRYRGETSWKRTNSPERHKSKYDKSRRAKQLPPLEDGTAVFLQDRREHGSVLSKASSPRSYYVVTPYGTFRRNRKRLIVANERVDTEDEDDDLPDVPDAQDPAQQQAEEQDIEVESDDAEGEKQPTANKVEPADNDVGAEEGATVLPRGASLRRRGRRSGLGGARRRNSSTGQKPSGRSGQSEDASPENY